MTQLYSWGARALFIGPAFGLSPHRNAVAVVAVGLQAPFELSWNAHDYRRCRSALIPPNTLQHLRETSGAMAFLYVDAVSNDYAQLLALAATNGERSHLDLRCEPLLIGCLNRLRVGGIACWREARAALEQVLKGDTEQKLDAARCKSDGSEHGSGLFQPCSFQQRLSSDVLDGTVATCSIGAGAAALKQPTQITHELRLE